MSNNSNQYIQVGGGIIAILFGILQGVDWLFSKYEIDNFYFNVILIILLIGLISSLIIFLAKKNKIKNISLIKSKKKLFFIIIIIILLLFVFVFFFKKINNNDSLVNEKIPELISLFDNGNINEVFLKTKSLLIDYPDNEIIKNFPLMSKHAVKWHAPKPHGALSFVLRASLNALFELLEAQCCHKSYTVCDCWIAVLGKRMPSFRRQIAIGPSQTGSSTVPLVRLSSPAAPAHSSFRR